MIAFFWRIWASRYSRLLPRGSTWVQSAHSSSNSSSLSPEERDGEETRAPITLLLLLLFLVKSHALLAHLHRTRTMLQSSLLLRALFVP